MEKKQLGRLINNFVEKFGYVIAPKDAGIRPDMREKDFEEIYSACKPFTMTSIERMFGLYKAVKYAVKENIPGDFVECGVWKGGSSMLIAMTLIKCGVTNRKLYMYDTYEGMPAPTEKDKDAWNNEQAEGFWKTQQKDGHNEWCYSSLEEVKGNMRRTGYPEENIVFVKGKVEETIPQTIPQQVAILRLDTDWYESTYHELIHLYPLLKEKGVLVIDDYGHWLGCREAVDKYFAENKINILLNRVDLGGRIAIKTN